jgi:hypothetical protein
MESKSDNIELTPEAWARIREARADAEKWLSAQKAEPESPEYELALFQFAERRWAAFAREVLASDAGTDDIWREIETHLAATLRWTFEKRAGSHHIRLGRCAWLKVRGRGAVDHDNAGGRFVAAGSQYILAGAAWREVRAALAQPKTAGGNGTDNALAAARNAWRESIASTESLLWWRDQTGLAYETLERYFGGTKTRRTRYIRQKLSKGVNVPFSAVPE